MALISRCTLGNGLKVVHTYDGATPMVALNLLYNVGARDESPSLTGMAHLFEHLMFSGSVNVPNYSIALQQVGGQDNAWTSNDFTNFYCSLPAVNAEEAFRVESDRMLRLSLTEKSLDIQQSVVIEEFKQTCLNRPYGDAMHHLRALAYKTHPYRFPVIGKEPDHISRVTLPDLEEFYYTHYAPNNAVLAVTGNIPADEAFRLADKWFGPIERRTLRPRTYQPEAPFEQARYMEVHGRVPITMFMIAHPMAAANAPGYHEADMLTDLLSLGQSSLFQKNVMQRYPVFAHADASVIGSDEPGLLLITGMLTSDADADVAEAVRILEEEAARLTDAANISAAQLEKARNRYKYDSYMDNLTFLGKAQKLAMAEMQGIDPEAIPLLHDNISAGQIASTASWVLRPENSATLVYRPE